MERLTNVKALEYVLANCELPEEVFGKVTKMKEQFEKKATSKKPTKVQVENEGLKAEILAYLVKVGEGCTVSQILEKCPAVEGLSNQKVSALMKQLVISGEVVRTEEKKKAYFSAVVTEG